MFWSTFHDRESMVIDAGWRWRRTSCPARRSRARVVLASRVVLARDFCRVGGILHVLLDVLARLYPCRWPCRAATPRRRVARACGGYMAARAACVAAASIWPMPVGSLMVLIVGARLVLVALAILVFCAADLVRRRFLSDRRFCFACGPASEVDELDQLFFMIGLDQVVGDGDQLRRHARSLPISSWSCVRELTCPAMAGWAHNLLECWEGGV
jgi:hypothetical protein